MKYKVGNRIVHLSHGIGTVTGIEERDFGNGKVTKFYIVTIQDNGAPKKVFVPFENVEQRTRKVITASQAKEVYAVLKSKSTIEINNQTWNNRYRHLMDLIHTGDILNIVEVFKNLYTLGIEKELNFGERKLFEHAKSLLVTELSISTNETPESIELKLEHTLKNIP